MTKIIFKSSPNPKPSFWQTAIVQLFPGSSEIPVNPTLKKGFRRLTFLSYKNLSKPQSLGMP